MLVVKVELWPGGDASQAEPLGLVLIANTGPVGDEDPDHCNYQVQVQDARSTRLTGRRITHWRRRGWKVLVRKAVEAAL